MLDVYLTALRVSAKPAVVFVHGGAFLDGNRNRSDQIYSNVLKYFACNGLVGVNVGYRLGRDARYPGGSLDVAAAVQWVQRNADDHGIDREQIFLMGHSAGGAHVGTYAYDRQMQPPEGNGLRGVIIVSGRVRAETFPDNPNAAKVALYYGTSDMDSLATFWRALREGTRVRDAAGSIVAAVGRWRGPHSPPETRRHRLPVNGRVGRIADGRLAMPDRKARPRACQIQRID